MHPTDLVLKVRYTAQYKSLDIPPLTQPRDGDAGYDLRGMETTRIAPGEQVEIPSGVHLAIPSGYVGLVKDRSSMARRGITTSAGVIDSSYRGEIVILLRNNTQAEIVLEAGERIAQLVIVQLETPPVVEVDVLGETQRGEGGFGSTGRH